MTWGFEATMSVVGRTRRLAVFSAAMFVMAVGCGGSKAADNGRPNKDGEERFNRSLPKLLNSATGANCADSGEGRETMDYDTTGDLKPDVRKILVRAGAAPSWRWVIHCRLADLNGDGVVDLVRVYDADGAPQYEEADRDFDKSVEVVRFFSAGQVMRRETDTDRNGVIDTKVYYENGVAIRAERDTLKRSGPDSWNPNRWEYFQEGRLVRVGTDTDGDGRVDQWMRDEALEVKDVFGGSEPTEAE